jgi:hypothetical protein|nr:right-handed parallel beta-helix repeat-containing protein [Candidatus Krumholzibacteria bacterium]
MSHRHLAISMAVGLLLITAGLFTPVQAATITVNASGGADHLTISAAVDAAQTGDTIVVSPGLYIDYFVVDKTLTLQSTDGSGITTISGPESGEDVLTIAAANVGLDGFTLTGGRLGLVIHDTADSPMINDLVIEETGWQQVSIPANLLTRVLPQLTLVGHASGQFDGVRVTTGTIAESTTMPTLPAGFVYYLESSVVTVSGPSGPVLTIPDGTIIKSFFSRFEIGSATLPGGFMANDVIFTSIYDDIGGDTNGNAAAPSPGNWQRIDFNAAARSDSSRVTGCTLRYGGVSTGVLEVQGSDPVVQGNTFSDNAGDLFIQSSASFGLNQTGNTLTQGNGFPVVTSLDHLQNLVFDNTIVPRGDDRWNGIGILESDVTTSFTMPVLPHGFVYFMNGSVIRVAGPDGPVLTIPDGTIVKGFFSRFEIGNATQPGGLMASAVTFTSIYDDVSGDTNGNGAAPSSANWQRIDFNATARSDSSRVTGCTLRYGGGGTAAIEVNGSDPLVTGNTFLDNRSDLMVVDSPSLGANQTGNTITQGNGLPILTTLDHLDQVLFNNNLTVRGDDKWNGISILDSEVTESFTMPALPDGLVYYLNGTDIIVEGESAPVLTIPAGTVIKGWFHRFLVGTGSLPGGLQATDTVFTSTNDDFAGDTNGSASAPNPGQWQRIEFGPHALTTSRLENCEIRYAGSPAIAANGSRPALRNCLIENSSGAAVRSYNTGANPSLILCTLANNGGGVLAENGGDATLVRCCFVGNDDYGVQAPAIAGPAGSLIAQDCWWGAVDGPGGEGPGSGDAVFGDVVFSPWYTTEACNDLSPAPDQTADIPTQVAVFGAAPNPFNPSTRIAFALPSDMPVALKIYGLDGRLIKTLVQDNLAAGRHEIRWDGQDSRGRTVAAGVYFYRLDAGNRQVDGKLMLIK